MEVLGTFWIMVWNEVATGFLVRPLGNERGGKMIGRTLISKELMSNDIYTNSFWSESHAASNYKLKVNPIENEF